MRMTFTVIEITADYNNTYRHCLVSSG